MTRLLSVTLTGGPTNLAKVNLSDGLAFYASKSALEHVFWISAAAPESL
jgi:hypothetical protein